MSQPVKFFLVLGVVLAAAALAVYLSWDIYRGVHPVAKEDPDITYCLKLLETVLLSPSTLEVVSVVNLGETVSVNFDAANSYGAPIRSHCTCYFKEQESTDGRHRSVNRLQLDDDVYEGEALAALRLQTAIVGAEKTLQETRTYTD